jgi:hypothetical protein
MYQVCVCIHRYLKTSSHSLLFLFKPLKAKLLGSSPWWHCYLQVRLLITSLSASFWLLLLLSCPHLPLNRGTWVSTLTRDRRKKACDPKYKPIKPLNSGGSTIRRLHESTWIPMAISQRYHLHTLVHKWFTRNYSIRDRSQKNQVFLTGDCFSITILCLPWASKRERRNTGSYVGDTQKMSRSREYYGRHQLFHLFT